MPPRPKKRPELSEITCRFHLPLQQASKQLGICQTLLKRFCRELGIPRWPYRRSLQKKQEQREHVPPDNVIAKREMIRQRRHRHRPNRHYREYQESTTSSTTSSDNSTAGDQSEDMDSNDGHIKDHVVDRKTKRRRKSEKENHGTRSSSGGLENQRHREDTGHNPSLNTEDNVEIRRRGNDHEKRYYGFVHHAPRTNHLSPSGQPYHSHIIGHPIISNPGTMQYPSAQGMVHGYLAGMQPFYPPPMDRRQPYPAYHVRTLPSVSPSTTTITERLPSIHHLLVQEDIGVVHDLTWQQQQQQAIPHLDHHSYHHNHTLTYH